MLSPHTEMTVRFSCFFVALILLLILEWLFPRRLATISKARRLGSNIAINFLNSFLARLIFPTAAIGVALYAEHAQIGLFHHVFIWQPALVIFLSVIALDMTIYFQHVLFHAVPFFWRIHRMHHMDLDLDVTTGIRFHPVEIILSLLIKFGAIMVIGAPPLAVLIFEIILNVSSMFSHSNIYLPASLDRLLQLLWVTPNMHSVHHSTTANESNSNFGFNLAIWDKLFGTYKRQPDLPYNEMQIGVCHIRDKKYCVNLIGMLFSPNLYRQDEYAINRRFNTVCQED